MKKLLLITLLYFVLPLVGKVVAQQAKTTNNPQSKGLQMDLQTVKSNQSTITKLWGYLEQPVITRMEYGASPGIIDLGTGVNNVGGEPDTYMEIVTGSDEYDNIFPELNSEAYGIWRCFDALGNMEWAIDTKSDEARTSVAIADIDNDLNFDIATGTTSGWCVEVMNKLGSWTPGVSDAAWTFPYEPQRNGSFMWHSSPAIGELITGPDYEGLEVVAGNNPLMSIWAFDGDNSDGIDNGVTVDISSWGFPGPTGTEGVDWDVLWVFQTNGSIIASPAIGDIDGDGSNEVLCGSKDSTFYCINGITGVLKWSLKTNGMITGSAGLADFDNNGRLEIVFGSQDGSVYFILGDLNNDGTINPSEYTTFITGAAVFSSPAIADVNSDGQLEVLIGSDDWNLYCLHYSPVANSVTSNWAYLTGGAIQSSPAITNSGRTNLTIYTGSADSLLYILNGIGSLIASYLTNGQIITSTAIADIDGDNKLEIAFTTWSAPDEFLVLRDDGSNVTAFSSPWPMFRHDARHTGLYDWVPTVLAADVGVTEIQEPEGSIWPGTVLTPKAIVHNFSANPVSSFTVTFQIRNSSNTLIFNSTQTISNLASHSSQQVSFPTLAATAGQFHTSAFTTLSGDLDLDNNGEDGFYLVVQSQWAQDFELDGGGFDASQVPNGWERGISTSGPTTAHSGSKVWATNLSGDYGNSASWKLDSPLYIAQQDNPELSFWHWYDIQNHRDGGNIKISLDGVNWTLISPVGGYPEIATWNNSGIPDEPCYNETSEGWKLTSFILPVLSGQQFTIRWHLGSDNITTRPGWYLDDVMGFGFAPIVTNPATVNLKVFLEGLFNPVTHRMFKAQDANGNAFPGLIADKVQILFADPTYPYSVHYTVSDADLNQDGSCAVTAPLSGSYYLVVKHRNSIETWSSVPINLSLGGSVSYNFSTSDAKAYGNNLKEIADRWVIYCGDVNQDGTVNALDQTAIQSSAIGFVMGYLATDVNGDGVVDAFDLVMTDNNAAGFVMVQKP